MKTRTSKRHPAKILLWSGLVLGGLIFMISPKVHAHTVVQTSAVSR